MHQKVKIIMINLETGSLLLALSKVGIKEFSMHQMFDFNEKNCFSLFSLVQSL